MNAVDEVKARLDIVDTISAYIQLQKAGRNYKAICPFHSEKTPSLIIFPETQTWHCFGACGTGGDVFSFVMKYENLDFGEALRALAEKAGVTLETPRQRDSQQQKQLEKLFDIHAVAATYFHNVLRRSEQGQPGRDYAAQRGLSEETVQRFQLGFAPNAWQALSDHLLSRGYQRQDLLDAGLITVRKDGGYYDRFRGRFIIPIRDVRGRVIAFGGRILNQPEGARQQAKYLNSPQTALFNKSHVLFGIDVAKGAIRAKGVVVIVEGYMDVLQAHQAGVGNVVASMGTALTGHQLELLKRMTKKYVLALDPDSAGDRGTLRGLAVARQTLDKAVPTVTSRGWIRYESRLDADIRIMALPEGQDPDDLIRETPELWDALVDSAVPIVDYYFEITTADLNVNSAKGKSEAVRRLVPILAEISDQVEQTHYIQKLARMVRMDEPSIRRQLGVQSQLRAKKPTVDQQALEQPSVDRFELEERCLATFFRRPEWLNKANKILDDLSLGPLREDDFLRTENRALFGAWQSIENSTSWQEWIAGLGQSLQSWLDFLLENGPDVDELSGENAERDFERSVLRLRNKNLERVLQNLQVLQAESLEQGDPQAKEYQHKIRALIRTIRLGLDQAMGENTAQGRRKKRDQVVSTRMDAAGVA